MSNTVVTPSPGLMPAADVECRMYCVNGKIVSLLLLLELGGLTPLLWSTGSRADCYCGQEITLPQYSLCQFKHFSLLTENRMLPIMADGASISVWCGVECWLCSYDLNTLTDDVAR